MIDHFNLPVSDIEKSLEFYKQILAPLGYSQLFRDQDAYGFGLVNWQFGIYSSAQIINSLHVAFKAPDRKSVDEFYTIALGLGAKSNGSPGFRDHYGLNYYAAFVLDPDEHNVEAVFRSQ